MTVPKKAAPSVSGGARVEEDGCEWVRAAVAMRLGSRYATLRTTAYRR
jgi:hypothetical protein